MDPRPVNCKWPDCKDYDERCKMGVNIPCIVFEAQACRSDFASGYRSGLFVGFALGAMFVVGVLGALTALSLIF